MKKTVTIPKQIIEKYKFYESNIKVLQDEELRVDFQDTKLSGVNAKYGFI